MVLRLQNHYYSPFKTSIKFPINSLLDTKDTQLRKSTKGYCSNISEWHRQTLSSYTKIKATFMTCLMENYLSLSVALSLLYSSTSSLLLSVRQRGDWRKKASRKPIPNPQQALKHMDGGGTAAALPLSCS